MSDATQTVLVAELAALVCGLVGLLVPWAVARLPEPPPDPVLAELAAKALEGPLTARQQVRLDEGPKRLYTEIAAGRYVATVACLASAAAGALVVLGVGLEPALLVLLPLVPAGVLLALVDLRTRLLPARVVWAATLYALGAAVVLTVVDGDPDPLVRAVLGFVVGFVVFFVLWFVYPPGMGYGDVRLAGLCGLLLGYQGWAEWAVGLYSSFLLFGLPAVVVALLRRSTRVLKFNVPFGPFLLAGVLVGLLAGQPLVDRLVGG